MRKSGEVLRQLGVIEPQTFAERIGEFLRGIHPAKTAANVEADTGISAKTVSKWLERASSPSGTAYHRLIEAYGPELFVFVSPDASPASLQEAARVCQQARLERQAAALSQQLKVLREGRP
ncbi:hypothetical protein AOPFMNJM_4003 [Methylobacterium jeotgali]|uniref:Transcriptional regulator n=2 Tax=Methylobacteriaceae TaxID=119045 RepID=A0ABQ4T325_9HYPH|nr:hypothetical protein AwMethylo_22720 [Methylobacterium sp.]GJE08660.1 hypothetical protein AOPFMNJM_4003 [Methylobacterium jeotgali]